jgi:hypothetical protein
LANWVIKSTDTYLSLVYDRMHALGFDKLVSTGPESILCFRPITPSITSPMRLIWRKDQQFSHAAMLFMNELKQCCE